MIDWDTLRIVLSVHRMGGLTGASRDLQVSQPTVSRHLARAESDLNCKLFDRRQGRLIATEAGLIVIREAERVEQQLRRMQDSVRLLDNEMSGPLTISVPQQLLPYCVTDEMRDFRELYPDIAFTVVVSDQMADVTIGTVDIVFRVEENPKPSLWGRRIAELGLSYYAHQSVIDAYSQPGQPLTAAKGVPLIMHDGVTSSSLDETRDLFPHGIPVANSNSLEATATMIGRGMGVGRLPHMVAHSLPELLAVAHPPAKTRRSLWILTHKDMRSILRIERFINFVDERMKSKAGLFCLPDDSEILGEPQDDSEQP